MPDDKKGVFLDRLKESFVHSFAWKSAQSAITLGMTFIIQIVLARILTPDDFGIVAIATTFMTLANTVIETSFSSSIIQREKLEQSLISSVFYANLLLSLMVYAILFVIAPCIANFYQEPILVPILRVQGLRIIFSGLYSIQQSFMNRKMRFKMMFFCGLAGTVAQAVVGFGMAYAGAGVWALVYSTLASCFVTGGAMILLEPWKPDLYFSMKQAKTALSFSSKILAIRVIRKVFYNIRVLAIGRVCSTEVLGYFNKGFQFPSTAMTVVDGSLTSVAFSSLSRLQNEREKMTSTLRQYVRVSMFLCVPMMVGMSMVAKSLVMVVLTEKWLDCVPFMQIICFTQLLVPLNVKTTAFEAIGKSGLSMKLHLSGIFLSIVLLFVSIPFGAYMMTFSGFVSSLVLQVAIVIETRKLLNYSVAEQLCDAACGLVPTIAMAIAVAMLQQIFCGYFVQLCLSVLGGVVVFVLTAALTRNSVFFMIWNAAKQKIVGTKQCRLKKR